MGLFLGIIVLSAFLLGLYQINRRYDIQFEKAVEAPKPKRKRSTPIVKEPLEMEEEMEVVDEIETTEAPKVRPTPKDITLTKEFKEVLHLLNETDTHVFVSGKAGTGKSSLLRYFMQTTPKNYVVLAPTGIAAFNVGGQTIHSFFRFSPRSINPQKIKADPKREELFEQLELVIIDEISMVRSDLMDAIDQSLRLNRNRPKEPFGGVQMAFIGDLFQLPPVVSSRKAKELTEAYGGIYFFDAPVFKKQNFHLQELTRVFRQDSKQRTFKNILNKIRNNTVGPKDLAKLNAQVVEKIDTKEAAIFLTSKRDIAREFNESKLLKLRSKLYEYEGFFSGKYQDLSEAAIDKLEDQLPAPYRLALKKNAQVMMLKNDPEKRWVNGTVGTIEKLTDTSIAVQIKENIYELQKETWQETDYALGQKGITGTALGEFTQYPIRLAYAMTIHKSQGKTFDKIGIDVGKGAFAHGQMYVALSRCKTLEGIRLHQAITVDDIKVDPRIVAFYEEV